MAAFVRFTSKSDGLVHTMQKIDDLMREHFGAPPSTKEWYENWYNLAGFNFAVGRTESEIKEDYPELADVVDWLTANYHVDNWYGR